MSLIIDEQKSSLASLDLTNHFHSHFRNNVILDDEKQHRGGVEVPAFSLTWIEKATQIQRELSIKKQEL